MTSRTLALTNHVNYMTEGIQALLQGIIPASFRRIVENLRGVNGEFIPPGIVTSASGYQLGPITKMNFFPAGNYDPNHLALVDHFDRFSKEIHKDDTPKRKLSRHLGGPYEAHPIDMLRVGYDIFSRLEASAGENVRNILMKDPVFPACIIGHDIPEDFSKIRELNSERKAKLVKYYALTSAPESGGSFESQTDNLEKAIRETEAEIQTVNGEIKGIRTKFVRDWHQTNLDFISAHASGNGLSAAAHSDLVLASVLAVGVDDWLSRHTEVRLFHDSMYRINRIFTVGEYLASGVGGPFQTEVMAHLGLERTVQEPLHYFWRRVYAKAVDRIALSRERELRFKAVEAKELASLLEKNPHLKETYGGVDFSGRNGYRAYKLSLLYRNFIVLHNMALALNNYGQATFTQKSQDPVAFAYLHATLMARAYILEETKKIIDELKPSYKSSLKNESGTIETDVINLAPSEIEQMTGDGPISRGMELDKPGTKWAQLDNSVYHMSLNYRDALIFERLLRRFTDAERNKHDIGSGQFRLFSIGGLTDKVTYESHPKPFESHR